MCCVFCRKSWFIIHRLFYSTIFLNESKSLNEDVNEIFTIQW
nr:MAG TPA: hypothetical protein [Ackermannviridae sp.]